MYIYIYIYIYVNIYGSCATTPCLLLNMIIILAIISAVIRSHNSCSYQSSITRVLSSEKLFRSLVSI